MDSQQKNADRLRHMADAMEPTVRREANRAFERIGAALAGYVPGAIAMSESSPPLAIKPFPLHVDAKHWPPLE